VKATVSSPGQAAEKLCVADADTMVDDMYDVITSANSFVDVASLAGPNGRYGTMFRNAVTFLASKKRPIEVRMIFGNYPTNPTDTDKVLGAVTSNLPANSQVHVNVGAIRSSYKSWNHAKIVAADGVRAIVGGHNLWEGDYLSIDPVTDVSIRVTGGAAATAHRFVDQLWAYDCGSTWNLTTSHSVSSNARATCAPSFTGRSVARAAGGSVVIGVGRLGDAGNSNASDDALVALLGSAKKTIRFSLQDLGPPQFAGIVDIAPWPMATLTEIVKALGRGVDVYITLSNEDAEGTGDGNYSNGWSTKDTAEKILEVAKTQLPGIDVHALLCKHLHVTSLGYNGSTTWADGHPIPNHSKLTIIDDQAFYVGSQNLYIANLSEFGFIVDDANATASLVQHLWTPEWASSSRNAVTGPEAATCQLP
jgi:phosphatidylserine/phosphatidylglycerophosphate/cardiolipin synthase-like enzyme